MPLSNEIIYFFKKDFPDGTVDENLPANAGDTGSTPGRERFHMLWVNLGPHITTAEA